jgi:hypothetical protein
MATTLRRDVTVSTETGATDPFTNAPVTENVTLPAGSEVPSEHEEAVRAVDEANGGGYVVDTGQEPGFLADAAAVDPVRQALLAQCDALLGDQSKVDLTGMSNEQLAQFINVREFARQNPEAEVDLDADVQLAQDRNDGGNVNAPSEDVRKASSPSRRRGRRSETAGGSDS